MVGLTRLLHAMKSLLSFLILILLCLTAKAQTNPMPLTLAWDYPTVDNTASFVISQTTNLSVPLTNWTQVTNIASTNCQVGTSQSFTNKVLVSPGQYFWTVQVSNFWGISSNSNIANTPPLPVPVISNSISR
jgi:hypothetical protein